MGMLRMVNRGLVDQANRNGSGASGRTNANAQRQRDAQVAKARVAAQNLQRDLLQLREELATQAPVASEPESVEPVQEEDVTLSIKNPDRPKTLDDVVGQADLIQRLRVVVLGSVVRNSKMPHCLLIGSAGMGKTSLSEIISEELGVPMISTTGMMLKSAKDLVGLVVKTQGPCILFTDEIHSASRQAREGLYQIMEDGKVDVLSGTGNETVAYTHPVPDLIVVGATTRSGLLEAPLKDRFGFIGQMSFYTDEELGVIVGKCWERNDLPYAPEESLEVARRSRGVPRTAIKWAKRTMDYAAVRGMEEIEPGTVNAAMDVFGVDSIGLEELDYKILCALTDQFSGRAVGIEALASLIDVDLRTVMDAEGYLCRTGLMTRTRSGRMATADAYALLRD